MIVKELIFSRNGNVALTDFEWLADSYISFAKETTFTAESSQDDSWEDADGATRCEAGQWY